MRNGQRRGVKEERMRTLALYVAASVAEIGGCFALWAVTRNGASALWLAPGALSLILFGWLLTRVDVDFAGRAYAVYGGIYIAASLIWLWGVEGRAPDRWDVIGAAVAIAGAMIILYMPRSA
jgi:small multidrug resistance family-3 protein